MEKHVIFLYPLHPVIQELKDILEKDGGYDINEIDDVNEYKQLIGVIGQSVTFTSDFKKIVQSLDIQRNLIKNNISKIVLMGKIQNYQQETGILRVSGIQEILPENTPVKALQLKLNIFLKGFEQVEVLKQKEKEKAEKETQKIIAKKNQSLFGEKEEEKDTQKIVSKKSESLFGEKEENNQFIQSKEHKSLFEEKEDSKRSESTRGTYKPLDVRENEANVVKKESTPFTIAPVTGEKVKDNESSPIVEVNEDVKVSKSNKSFQVGSSEEKEKKKAGKLIDSEDGTKVASSKTSLRVESTTEDNKSNSSPLAVDEDTKVSSSKESLRVLSPKGEEKLKRKKELEEAAAIIRKHREGIKLTEEEEKKVQKHLKVGEDESQKTKKLEENDQGDYEKKKYESFHVDEDQGKSGKKSGLDVDSSQTVGNRAGLHLDSEKDSKKPYKAFRVDGESDRDGIIPIEEAKKQFDTDTLNLDELDIEDNSKRTYTKATESEEKTDVSPEEEDLSLTYPNFYYPPSGVSTFIPLIVEVLHSRPFNSTKFMQFICFMFTKKLGGELTYIIEREKDVELLASTYALKDKNWDFEKYYNEKKINQMREFAVPTWSDNTFQDSIIHFYFPFYYNKERLGVAHAVFDLHKINNAQEAMEAELLIVMARTIYLKEFNY